MDIDILQLIQSLARQFGYADAQVHFRDKKQVASVRIHNGIPSFSMQYEAKSFPNEVFSALIFTLLARCKHMTQTQEYHTQNRLWRTFIREQSSTEQQRKLQHERALCSPVGQTYHLMDRFTRLECQFDTLFQGFFARSDVLLTWGTRATYKKFGMWWPAARIIEISKTLDSPQVPVIVLDYVIYHEMLHAYAGKLHRGQRYHTRQFRALEQQYPHAREASEFLTKIYKARGNFF